MLPDGPEGPEALLDLVRVQDRAEELVAEVLVQRPTGGAVSTPSFREGRVVASPRFLPPSATGVAASRPLGSVSAGGCARSWAGAPFPVGLR